MAKTTDFTKMMQDMMGAFPVDTKAMQDSFKSHAALGEKLAKVVLEAAEKSAEVSNKWTKAQIAKVGEVATVKEDVAEYSKAITDFASASAEMAAEHMSAFAEIAKRVQMDTVELMLAAGKDMSAEATAAMQKATADVTAAAKKATEEVTAAAKKAAAAAK
ncbi:MAG: phasin [Pararhodobacter sp.]